MTKMKQYRIEWIDEVKFSANVMAEDEEDARNQFASGDTFNVEQMEVTLLDDSLSIELDE